MSMMVTCNDIAIIEHVEVVEHENYRTRNSPVNIQHNPYIFTYKGYIQKRSPNSKHAKSGSIGTAPCSCMACQMMTTNGGYYYISVLVLCFMLVVL